MFLSQLKIEGIRGLENLVASFTPNLNVIVGPNNCGKSSLIDAIRLALSPRDSVHPRWISEDDFTRTSTRSSIHRASASLVFEGLSIEEKARYVEALGNELDTVTFGKRFELETNSGRIRTIPTIQDQLVGWDSLPNRSLVHYVYIEPLRDAKREFKHHTGTRLARIFRLVSGHPEAEQELKSQVQKLERLLLSDDDEEGNSSLASLPIKINEELSKLTQSENSSITMLVNDQDLSRLMRRFRLSFLENGESWEIDDVGLGYANLLYLATLLLELSNQPKDVFSILLIEEPEAHLHPKLQETLVDFLKVHAAEKDNLQILLTTHSPVIAAKAGCQSLCGLNKEGQETIFWHANSLQNSQEEKAKLNRFFLSHRPEAIFSKHVLLVEGTAEELLLPALFEAYIRGTSPDKSSSKRRIQRLRESLCICSVQSASFSPHWNLLKLSRSGMTQRRLAVLTDADWSEDQWGQTSRIRNEPIKATAGGARLDKLSLSRTGWDHQYPQFGGFLSHSTFEHELIILALRLRFLANDSRLLDAMKNIFQNNHCLLYKTALSAFREGETPKKWAEPDIVDKGDAIWNRIRKSSLKKANFAQELAFEISNRELAFEMLPSELEKFVNALVTEND
ncbi:MULTISPECIES: AAA family ATPase [unclassified Corynebacterium]|uniref:ATP-dependent nuclease n=1 Tax=Corynebacterium TaxID=1716 RepID=UPI00254B85B2|nr:AAA family ATPase [Corynebacterium sp. MSK107]MDK8702843.1 AAA family ATPase [Corynebacterium sp. MSK107]